jgi:hypothetical protein
MINRLLHIAGLIILIIGIVLIIKSISYQRYTNEKVYQDKYMELTGDIGDSEKFYKLREEYLTPKFDLENYGITSIVLGLGILTISLIGLDRLKTPSKKIWIVIIGIIAALITNVGYVGDLFLEMSRDSYPHWADSLAIPLMGVPFLILISLGWVGINLIGIKGDFKTRVLIFPIRFDNLNYWYAIILALTIIFTVWIIIDGYFWQVLSGFLWIYFYLSIMIGIRQMKIDKIKN